MAAIPVAVLSARVGVLMASGILLFICAALALFMLGIHLLHPED
jgi:hypothetical protein